MRLLAFILLHLIAVGTLQAQIFKLPNPNPHPGDQFGIAASISGDRVLIGASGTNTCEESSGAAYVFEHESETGKWLHEATLQPEDCAAGLYFGKVLALVGDLAAIASYKPSFSNVQPNSVYLFERDSSGWNQTAKLTSPDNGTGPFASSIAIEEGRVIISAAGDIPENRFHGAAYVFTKSNNGWLLSQRLRTNDPVGRGVFGSSLSAADSTLVVSASRYFDERNGSLHIYRLSPDGTYALTQTLSGVDDFELPTDVHDDRILVGARRARRDKSGLAMIYRLNKDGIFVSEETLLPLQPFEDGGFGSAVALDADLALVVGYDEQLQFEFNIDRVIYVFKRLPDNTWRQRHVIDVGSVFFGSSVAIEASVAVIGEASESEPGKAYIIHVN